MRKTFGIIGGDRRQAELSRLLEQDGAAVRTYGLGRWTTAGAAALKQTAEADVIVLPLPLCKGEGVLNCEEDPVPTIELFRLLRPEQKILAGNVQPRQHWEASVCGLTLEDYFLREELTVANAAATAEGAIQVAMEHLDRTLLGMECLVLGFGRIGKLLSCRLQGLGARVTASARKPGDLAWIQAYGWNALNTQLLHGRIQGFALVFNTIPSCVLDESLLAELPPDCLCIDLASQPGIDMAAAEKMGVNCVWGRSLPGRLAPCTAAEVIRNTINYMLLEGDPT